MEIQNPISNIQYRPRVAYLWVIGIIVYACVVAYIGWQPLREAFSIVKPIYLGSMAALMVVSLWLRALKWRWALGPGLHAFGLFFLSKGAGGYSPARIGELAPLLLRQHRTPQLAAWIILDRLLETGATIGLGIAGCIALGLPHRAMGAVFAGAMALLVIVPYLLLTRRILFIRLAGLLSTGCLLHRACLVVADMSEEITAFRGKMAVAAAWSVGCTALDLLVGLLLYGSFGCWVSFSLLAVVQCAHGLASALPFLPNATGGPYLVAAGLLYQLGGVPENVLAAAIGVNVALSNLFFWFSFAIGAAGLPGRERKFEDQARLFDYLASDNGLYRYTPESLARLNDLVQHKGRLLDLGCGDGTIAQALGADEVFAADISARCAALANRRKLNALVADATQGVPFRDNSLDTVYCVDVLHHLHGHWESVLREVHRVLGSGGTLVLVEPDARYRFVRWTQAPGSPIRVAPYENEPAIYPAHLEKILNELNFECHTQMIRIDGSQITRSVFPLWQRVLKAPFVIALAIAHGKKPNKFAIIARKTAMSCTDYMETQNPQ